MKKFLKILFSRFPFKEFLVSIIYKTRRFPGSKNYWEQRYLSSGNSGPGSYKELSEFKAKVINNFISHKNIQSVIEFGCGDGNQLKLMKYKEYLGIDVSQTIISRCQKLFLEDKSKNFITLEKYQNESGELSLSLDVIFHLVEDHVFVDYLNKLFNASKKFVVIYSSNYDSNTEWHVKHRKFTDWVEQHRNDFELIQTVKNKYPFSGDVNKGSFSDFYIYQKIKI